MKALTLAFFYWCNNAKICIFAIKTPVFLATNIEQHVGNVSVFDAHFGIFKAKILVMKLNFENGIIFWRYVVKILALRLL